MSSVPLRVPATVQARCPCISTAWIAMQTYIDCCQGPGRQQTSTARPGDILVAFFPQAKLKRSPAPAAGCGTSLTYHVHLKYSKQRDPRDKPTVQSKTRTHKKPTARVTDQSPSVSGGNRIAGETIYDHRLELSL